MIFYNDAVVIMNSRCGDPQCNLVHPRILRPNLATIVIFDNVPDAMAIMGKRQPNGKWEGLAFMAYAVGYDEEDNDRLYILFSSENPAGAISLAADSEEDMRKQIEEDSDEIFGELMRQAAYAIAEEKGQTVEELTQEAEEDPTGLAGLNPDDMAKA